MTIALQLKSTKLPYVKQKEYIPRITLRLQVELERTHRQKKKTNRLKIKRDQLADAEKKIPSLSRKQSTHLQTGNQTYTELRN